MHVCIISFSSRADGNCAQIARYIKSHYDSAVLYLFSDFSISPCGTCDYECFKNNADCPNINDMENKLLEAVSQCDLAYYVVPNYCDYPCANYFIFNERSQCFFQQREDRLAVYEKVPKKFIAISNTDQDNFIKAFSYQVEGTPDTLFLRAKDYGKKSINGDLLSCEKVKTIVSEFISKQ